MEFLLGNNTDVESSNGIIHIPVPSDFPKGSSNMKMSINTALTSLRHDNARYVTISLL